MDISGRGNRIDFTGKLQQMGTRAEGIQVGEKTQEEVAGTEAIWEVMWTPNAVENSWKL